MARGGNSVVVIKWRDIPAQVNAQMGRDRYQVVLSAKFQRAIDRAKRKANIYTAEEDIAQWSRDPLPLEGTLAAAAQKVADEIERLVNDHQVGFFILADEEPTINRRKFIEFCEELIARGLPDRVKWGINTRVTDIYRDNFVHIRLPARLARMLAGGARDSHAPHTYSDFTWSRRPFP